MRTFGYCIKPRKGCGPFYPSRKLRFYNAYIRDRKIKFYRGINRKDIAWAESCIKQFQDNHKTPDEGTEGVDGYTQGFLRALQIFTKKGKERSWNENSLNFYFEDLE